MTGPPRLRYVFMCTPFERTKPVPQGHLQDPPQERIYRGVILFSRVGRGASVGEKNYPALAEGLGRAIGDFPWFLDARASGG